MQIILSVRAFDHDRKVVLRPTSCKKRANTSQQFFRRYSQHRSDDHWVLSLEIVRHADGEHFHRDDLATTPAARSAVHVWVACDEELSELVHEFARCSTTAAYEAGAARVRGDQLRSTSRRETRGA